MPEPLPSKKPEGEETLQFLKREEVRTMAKDVALLREEEAKKERDRITKIKTEEPKQTTQVPTSQQPQPVQGLKTLSGSERPIPPSLMPHAEVQKPVFVRARTRSEKVLIRVIVIGVLLFVLLNGFAFGYWYFTRKATVEVVPEPEPTPVVEVEELAPEPLPIPAPVSFFEAPQQELLLGNSKELLPELQTLLSSSPLGFLNIVVKTQLGILSAQEFLEKAKIAMPLTLQQMLGENVMLFSYHTDNKKRLGIIFELKDTEGAAEQLQSWETTLEQDTKPFWEIVGQKGSSYTPFFRQAAHQNNLVRFQTFSVVDFGVVYTLFGSRLILSTSFESLTRAVDQIIQSR